MKDWEALRLLREKPTTKISHPLLKDLGPVQTVNAFIFWVNQNLSSRELADGWEIVSDETFGWDEALKRLNARKVVRCLDDEDPDMTNGGIRLNGELEEYLFYAKPRTGEARMIVIPAWFTGRWEEVKG